MEQVVPWAELCSLLEPFYPRNDGVGRPTVGLERMVRVHFLKHWFNLSDPAVREARYDSLAMRAFVGIDLGREGRPMKRPIAGPPPTCWSGTAWENRFLRWSTPTLPPRA
jgi:hypothetical protein